MVKLGSSNCLQGTKTLCPMLKEISKSHRHCDLLLQCQDGQIQVHSLIIAAQSKFLKKLLSESWGNGHIPNIQLPSVQLIHLKRAVKFMYTGQLKMSKNEIEKKHLVWYVNHILIDLFRVDAKLNLPAHLLVPPPHQEDDDDNDDGENDKETDGDQEGNTTANNFAPACSSQASVSRGLGAPEKTRQCDVTNPEEVYEAHNDASNDKDDSFIVKPDEENNDASNNKDNSFIVKPNEENNDASNNKDNVKPDEENNEEIMIIEQERVPTPDIIDLLDSDDDEEVKSTRGSSLEEESSTSHVSDQLSTAASEAVSLEDINFDIPVAPRLIPRNTNHQSESDLNLSSGIGVYRGKLRTSSVRSASRSRRGRGNGGVRKHHHIPWTMSGLKRSETISVIKEETDIFECEECGVKYDKFRSLQIHKQRSHNERLTVECPEGCGKLLSSTTAIRKHLLSHRPEHTWPHACPLCGKRFQARGDIPKHLMTRLHENDSIPRMGTKEWFDLIYWDDPKYNYDDLKIKLEKQKAKLKGPWAGSQKTGEHEVVDMADEERVDDVERMDDVQEIGGLEDQNAVLVQSSSTVTPWGLY